MRRSVIHYAPRLLDGKSSTCLILMDAIALLRLTHSESSLSREISHEAEATYENQSPKISKYLSTPPKRKFILASRATCGLDRVGSKAKATPSMLVCMRIMPDTSREVQNDALYTSFFRLDKS